MLNRRTLLRNAASLSAGLALPPVARSFGAAPPLVTLRAGSEMPFALPADFMGLGYEMSSVATVGLLSPENERYVRLVNQLGGHGVMRVGGIVADFTRYDPNGTPSADMHHTVITRPILQQFAAFLNRVHWTTLWSVNFAQGTIAEAVAEAVAVHAELGDRLQAFEIGNEVENYANARRFATRPTRTSNIGRNTTHGVARF